MDSNFPFNIDNLATNPQFDFLKTLLQKTNDDDYDFSCSPYDNITSDCIYLDETEFNSTFKNCNDLSMMSVNVQSLTAKFNELNEMIRIMQINNCSPDIICLQELWSFPCDSMFSLLGYHPLIFKLRNNYQGGGIGIFIKNKFKYTHLPHLSVFSERILETLFIEIEIRPNHYCIIGSLYRPGTKHPSYSLSESYSQFVNLLSNICNELINTKKQFYLLGDFNLNLLEYNKCSQVTEYIDLLFSFGLIQIISKPTRCTLNSATILDHIITNQQVPTYNSVILVTSLSDHFPVTFMQKTVVRASSPYYVESRNFSQQNLLSFGAALRSLNWDHVTCHEDSQLSYDSFFDTFNNLYEFYFPTVKSKFNRNKHKVEMWMSNGLLISRAQKIKLCKLKFKSPTPVNILNFKNYRNLYNKTIRAAKKLYYEKQFKKFQANLKKSWQLLFSAINKAPKKTEQSYSLLINGEIESDPLRVANKFNEFFTNIATSIVSEIIPTDHPPDDNPRSPDPVSLFSFSNNPVTLTEISDAIQSLEPKKTLDHNGFSVSFISKFSLTLSYPLHHIISTSLLTGIIPLQMKVAKVIPIYKSGDKNSPDNFRPISLLNVFSKIIEKVVANRLTNYLETNNLFSNCQYGFRKNHSTVHPLTKFLNFIAKANNAKEHTVAIFCDLKKAFDTCDHKILLHKLHKIGVRGLELSWFQNYLSDRKQFVCIDGKCSNLLDILIGVPQGSILGPLLFLIYINDLPLCSLLFTLLFADDTTLMASNKNLQELNVFVNTEFKKVTDYFRKNKLCLHPMKTKYIVISQSVEATNFNFNIEINNNNFDFYSVLCNKELIHPIVRVTTDSETPAIKFLGVFIDPNLNFRYHTNHISKKITNALYFLRTSKNVLTPSALKSLYFSLVHCHLIYALPIWSSTTQNILENLETKQKIAIRIISHSKYNAHSEPIFKKLNILPLNLLIESSKLIFMQQYIQGYLPSTFTGEWSTIIERRRGEDQVRIRNDENFFIPFARTNFVERLPFCSFPRAWSNFNIYELTIIRNKVEFKLKLKKHFLSLLSDTIVCQRLLCPSCHLNV